MKSIVYQTLINHYSEGQIHAYQIYRIKLNYDFLLLTNMTWFTTIDNV